jgi:hypothetical protein
MVEEEMHRTIEFGAFKAAEWELRATARTTDMTPALAEGLRAYAMENVKREEDTCRLLSKQWAGLREKARAYLEGVAAEDGAEVVIEMEVEGEDADDDEGDVDGEEVIDDDGGEAYNNEEDPDGV